jgi:hypothetical protein
MTSFTFDTTVPSGPNNPSNDQPVMQSNNVSSLNILAVDHITYNSAGTGAGGSGGHHKQVTYDNNFVPGAIGDPQSVSYTNAGIADASHPQRFWKNSQGTFHSSAIRAWAFCTPAGVTANQQVNVASITRTAALPAGSFDIVLVTNSVNGTGLSSNFGILVSLQAPIIVGTVPIPINSSYIITGISTFTLKFISPVNGLLIDPVSFTFQVLQI